MFEQPSSADRAVLVQVNFRQQAARPDSQDSRDMSEFLALTKTAKIAAVASLTAVRSRPDPKYYLGKGKIAEIEQLIAAHQADLIIFNHELSPSQERNLSRALACRVISRTALILAIFAQRARSFEGKLQVELALLEHSASRLVRSWTHLERQKGGIGLRGGPGETQLEVDRRLLRTRIQSIEKRLEKVKAQRQQSRQARQQAEVPTVALVGYTNAGKSSLFNALTRSGVWVADQLFATLDPTLRSIHVPGVGKVVLADTVGFIKDLPHTLVNAFRATLEETLQADLLCHVVDASDERATENIYQVNQVLAEIGAQDMPQLLIWNKVDLISYKTNSLPPLVASENSENSENSAISVSALEGTGLDLLREALQGRLSKTRVRGSLVLSAEQGQLLSQLYKLQAVAEASPVSESDGGWQLQIDLSPRQWEKLCQQYPGLAQELHQ